MRHRLYRLLAALVRVVFRAALGAAIAGLIFTACLLGAVAYSGVPASDLYEMLDPVESVSQLAEILS